MSNIARQFGLDAGKTHIASRERDDRDDTIATLRADVARLTAELALLKAGMPLEGGRIVTRNAATVTPAVTRNAARQKAYRDRQRAAKA